MNHHHFSSKKKKCEMFDLIVKNSKCKLLNENLKRERLEKYSKQTTARENAEDDTKFSIRHVF